MIFAVSGATNVADDEMWLGQTKQNSRTQVYAGKKVHYLTGVLSVSCLQLAAASCLMITVQYFCNSGIPR